MMPAQCMGCGETVHSLIKASIKLSPVTKCQSCGKKVKKRGGWTEIIAILIFAGLIVYATSVSSNGVWILCGAVVFALYMTWWSWSTVPWDVYEPEPDSL
jgi:DNA-directed RNA polymerase subunit RPC12/RpoP